MRRKYNRNRKGKFARKHPVITFMKWSLIVWGVLLVFASTEWFMEKVNEVYVKANIEQYDPSELEVVYTEEELQEKPKPKYPCMYDDIEQLIICYSILNRANTEIALNVAWCESRYQEKVVNSIEASGVFQFLTEGSTKFLNRWGDPLPNSWKNLGCTGDPLNKHNNIDCATKVMASGGYMHWDCYKKIYLGWKI